MEMFRAVLIAAAITSALLGIALAIFSVKPEAQIRMQTLFLQSIALSLIAVALK